MEDERLVCLFVNLFFFGFFFLVGWILGHFKARRKFKAEIKLREEYDMSMKMWNDYINAMKGVSHEK